MPRKAYDGENPFEQSLNGIDELTYGTVDVPASGRIIAKPKDITLIRPDLRQPRRAIPAIVRGGWAGDPEELPTIFGSWQQMAEARLGKKIEVERLIKNVGEGEDAADGVAGSYLDLVRLAGSIYRDGLINPIRIARRKQAAFYTIESGERRWLAYNLLNLWVGAEYISIPAIERDDLDVWAQAAENGARQTLNAIGMARQLALLIMDMYEGDRDVQFDEFDQLVLPGECDRVFYAQVKDGMLYPIKRGMGQRISAATGLSADMIRKYRALLSIPDALWEKADEQNWTERAIRDYEQAQSAGVLSADSAISSPRSVTQVTLQDDFEADSAISSPRSVTQVTLQTRPRTSMGERMGLYSDPSRADEDEEERQYREALAALEADDKALRSASQRESTSALLDSMQADGVVGLLKLIKAYARRNNLAVLEVRSQEMMTISREDIRRLLDSGAWVDYMTGSQQVLSKAIAQLSHELGDYLVKLDKIAEEMRRKDGR